MTRLGFLFGAALAAWLLLGGSAAAQPELPCEIPPTVTTDTGLATGTVSSGAGWRYGADYPPELPPWLQRFCQFPVGSREPAEAWRGLVFEAVDKALTRFEADADERPFYLAALRPDGQFSYEWRVGLDWTHFSFDEYDGDDFDATVDRLTTGIAMAYGGRRGRASLVGLRFPWVARLDVDSAATPLNEDGPGDLQVFGSQALGPRRSLDDPERKRRGFNFLEWQVSLPTGEQDEGLGFGDPAARVGLRRVWSSRAVEQGGLDGRRERAFGEYLSEGDLPDGCSLTASDPTDPADDGTRRWEANVGLAYERILNEAGFDYLELTGGVAWIRQRWAFELDASVLHELGAAPPGAPRTEATHVDVGATYWVRLGKGERSAKGATYLRLSAESRVTNDGLVDRLTPTIGIHHFWNPRH